MSMRRTASQRLYTMGVICVLLLLSFLMLYPFWYCLVYSFSNSRQAMITNVTFLPVGFTLENYSYVFVNGMVMKGFMVSVYRTAAGILWALFCTGLAAYGISKKSLPFNRTLSIFFIIPMYVSGGLLPTYVLYHKLHLFNNFLVYILPHGFWAFNMLLMRSYFDTIPASLEEAAKIDGAGELRILLRIVAPLSMPIVAVIAMFVGVWHWNEWFEPLLYVTKQDLKPLQSILQRIIMETLGSAMEAQSGRVSEHAVSGISIQMATLIVSTVPIVMIYPFLQKYFIKGVMIGAVKA